MNKNLLLIFTLTIIAFITFSCENNTIKAEKEEIKQHLTEQGTLDQAIETDEGVFIVFTKDTTTTRSPQSFSTVNIKYTGYLLSGDVFDSTWGSETQLSLTSTIEGWRIALPYFTDKDIADIYIPSALAYGDFQDRTGSTGVVIEAGSILHFNIELVGCISNCIE